jgi:hypothetical protein
MGDTDTPAATEHTYRAKQLRSLSLDEVSAEVAGLPDNTEVVKLLVLGNSGVGKSMLLNATLGCALFESKFSAMSVTAKVEACIVPTSAASVAVIYNIPGLIEVDAENVRRNKACLRAAMQHLPTACTLVLFVLGHEGGRLVAQDVAAFMTVRNFTPEIGPSNCGFIVNKVPLRLTDDDEAEESARVAFEANVQMQLDEVMGGEAKVGFCDAIPPKARKDAVGEEMRRIHAIARLVLTALTPQRIVPRPDADIILDREALKAELEQVQRQLLETEKALGEDVERRAAKQAQQLESAKAAHAAQTALAHRRLRELQEAAAAADDGPQSNSGAHEGSHPARFDNEDRLPVQQREQHDGLRHGYNQRSTEERQHHHAGPTSSLSVAPPMNYQPVVVHHHYYEDRQSSCCMM